MSKIKTMDTKMIKKMNLITLNLKREIVEIGSLMVPMYSIRF
jgi:hypothetical protein